jgi:hypothetical protein
MMPPVPGVPKRRRLALLALALAAPSLATGAEAGLVAGDEGAAPRWLADIDLA